MIHDSRRFKKRILQRNHAVKVGEIAEVYNDVTKRASALRG